jgi:hypothetical protein
VPNQDSALFQYACQLPHHLDIVRRMGKKTERSEQVEDGIEPIGPLARQLAHVTLCVTEILTRSASARDGKQLPRIVQTVDVIACLGEQVGVAALPARHIQNACANGQCENVYQPRYLAPVTFRSEEGLVLEEIVGVERGFPPLATLSQKNTGSR